MNRVGRRQDTTLIVRNDSSRPSSTDRIRAACQELPLSECGSDEQREQMLARTTALIISIRIPMQGHLSITYNCMQDIMHTVVTGHQQSNYGRYEAKGTRSQWTQ